MQASVEAAEEKSGGLAYKWIVAGVVIFGLFMTVLDSTIVNTAIPRFETAFGASLTNVQWVLTAYMLAQGVATPLTAYLASRIGNKKLYLMSLVGFTVGSALCGLSWSLPVLIFFRIMQAAFGAFLSPLSITLLYTEFPPNERGAAMGALGIPILLGPALGPTLGGYLVTYAGWQLIFYINVPIGIIGAIMGIIFLRENMPQRVKFDFLGFLLAGIGLALVLYGLSSAESDGWGSSTVMGCIGGGLILLVMFVVLELRNAKAEKPVLLDLRVFGDSRFSTSIIASSLIFFALYGGLFVIPIYLQNLRGYSAFQSGLTLLPQALCSMVAVLLGGRLVDKIGVRAVVIPGLIILGISMYMQTSLTLTESMSTFQIALCLSGFSLGLCIQPLTVSMLSNIKPKMLSQASAMNTTVRFVMSSLAISIISTFLTARSKFHFANMAMRATPDSGMGHMITLLQAFFISKGQSAQNALAAAIYSVSGLLQQRSYMLAVNDVFWLTLTLIGVAIVATIFVGGFKKKSSKPVETVELSDEEQKALEEAMMAI
jgi:EmrB/QacA subfamily drug resistance transporter